MNRGASKSDFLSVWLALACMILTVAESTHGQPLLLRTETFDADPGWDGRNNRATDPAPRQIVQNFGFSSSSTNAGGPAGEIGGFITPAGEPAFYPGQLWLDNVTINGELHPFNSDPGWDQRNNRTNYISTNVRPRFDFGYSPGSNFAGGQSGGEIGGHTFRGASRLQFNGTRMAYYGARLTDTWSLNQPLHAGGKG